MLRSTQRRSNKLEDTQLDIEVQSGPNVKVLGVAVGLCLLVLLAALAQNTPALASLATTLPGSFTRGVKSSQDVKARRQYRVVAEVTVANKSKLQIIDEPIPAECHAEHHADYDGPSVKWGLGNKARSAAECCRQCQEFPARDGNRCNVWVWCGDPTGECWTADIHNHTTGDCWLKFQAEWDNEVDLKKTNLKVNYRLKFSPEFRAVHKTSPEFVPWVAGLIPSKIKGPRRLST